jgi:hypothetical protein
MADNSCLLLIRYLFSSSQHWSLPAKTPCLCLALAVLTLLTCTGCREEKKPAPQLPRAELKPTVAWLDRYYQASPPGNGWKISSLTAEGRQVLITVAIPPEQSSQIMRQPAEAQFRLVAEQICPGRDKEVWRQLPADSRVTVLPSVSGQVFIEVDCGF